MARLTKSQKEEFGIERFQKLDYEYYQALHNIVIMLCDIL